MKHLLSQLRHILTGLAGLVITILGVAGIIYPDRVMGMLGYAVVTEASRAARPSATAVQKK